MISVPHRHQHLDPHDPHYGEYESRPFLDVTAQSFAWLTAAALVTFTAIGIWRVAEWVIEAVA